MRPEETHPNPYENPDYWNPYGSGVSGADPRHSVTPRQLDLMERLVELVLSK